MTRLEAKMIKLGRKQKSAKLIEYAQSASPEFRAAAALGLGITHDTKNTTRIQVLLRDKEVSVQIAAAKALGKMRDPSGVEFLRKTFATATDEDLKAACQRSIYLILHPEEIEFDEDDDV